MPLNYETIPFRRFQLRNDFTDERDINGRLNVQIPLNNTPEYASTLKFGGVVRNKLKDVQKDRGLLVPQGTTVRFNEVANADYSDDGFLADGGNTQYRVGRLSTPESLEGFEGRYNATYEEDKTGNLQGSFNGEETISGGYVMLTQIWAIAYLQ